MQEVPGGGGGTAAGGGGKQAGGGPGKSELVEAIASGMRRSGMTPGVVRPPAMVAGEHDCRCAQEQAAWRCWAAAPLMCLVCGAASPAAPPPPAPRIPIVERMLCEDHPLLCEDHPPLPPLAAEYMAGGSLKSALSRKADIVAGALTRVVLALDAAKVCGGGVCVCVGESMDDGWGAVGEGGRTWLLWAPGQARPLPRACGMLLFRAASSHQLHAGSSPRPLLTGPGSSLCCTLCPTLLAGHGVPAQQEPGAL